MFEKSAKALFSFFCSTWNIYSPPLPSLLGVARQSIPSTVIAAHNHIRHCWAKHYRHCCAKHYTSLLGVARQSITDSRDKLGNDGKRKKLGNDSIVASLLRETISVIAGRSPAIYHRFPRQARE